MKKSDLDTAVQSVLLFSVDHRGDSKKAEEVVRVIFQTIKEALLREERVVIPHFGTFYVREVAGRENRDPQGRLHYRYPNKKAHFKRSRAWRLNDGDS